jgi:hypothetical protein
MFWFFTSSLDMFYQAPPPPPPPEGSHNPLDTPVEWYVDVPTSVLGEIFTAIPSIQERTRCSISPITGGDQRNPWTRLQIFGKPLAIHNSIIALKLIGEIVEVGYAFESPYTSDSGLNQVQVENSMPIYHAAWCEYYSRRH